MARTRQDDDEDTPRTAPLRIAAIVFIGVIGVAGVATIAWWLSDALIPG